MVYFLLFQLISSCINIFLYALFILRKAMRLSIFVVSIVYCLRDYLKFLLASAISLEFII